MATAIGVENLRKTFRVKVKQPGLRGAFRSLVRPEIRSITAVSDISFEVQRGEVLAFIGPNGAGKSTTIKLITGILHPDGGTTEVLGMNPHRDRKRLAYRIGTVFGQKSQLWFHLPASDSLNLLAKIYDLDTDSAKRRIAFLSDVFEIGEYIDQPVRKLSLGQRIRCEMAASLLHEPEILFLDEPTIGLDVVVKQRIRDLIRRINQEDSTTIFLTSHDVGDIEKICRRAIIINHGTIVWNDSIKNLKYSFLNRRIVDLKLDAPLKLSMAGVHVLKSREYSAKLEVDLDKVELEQVLHEILSHNTVRDINVSNPPMEEVIAGIYQSTSGADDD
jgi:ABC-2 type transport system ATP-binding protein